MYGFASDAILLGSGSFQVVRSSGVLLSDTVGMCGLVAMGTSFCLISLRVIKAACVRNPDLLLID